MVNFKQWALLLTVGILNIRADGTDDDPQCLFTVDEPLASTFTFTGVSTCSDSLNGYYYLKDDVPVNSPTNTVDLDKPVFIKVTSSNIYEDIDLPGYYKLVNNDEKIVVCKGRTEPCILVSPTSITSDCNSDLGKYILNNGVVVGCRNNERVYVNFAVPEPSVNKRDESNTEEYYLSQYTPNGAFGFDSRIPYYAIKIDETSITFDQSVNFEDYMLDVSTGKVIKNRKEDFCSANSGKHFYSCTKGKCIRRPRLITILLYPMKVSVQLLRKKLHLFHVT